MALEMNDGIAPYDAPIKDLYEIGEMPPLGHRLPIVVADHLQERPADEFVDRPSREQRRPRWRADRRVGVEVRETGAARGEAVEVVLGQQRRRHEGGQVACPLQQQRPGAFGSRVHATSMVEVVG